MEKILVFIYKFSYNLMWVPFKIVFFVFFRLKVESKENLRKLKGPLIIASSHACWIDPFLIGGAFPFNAKVYPIRFACWPKYFFDPKGIIFLWLFGTFPIKKGTELEKSLKVPLKVLKNRGVVGIFPEGIRRRDNREIRGKRGAAYLALKTDTRILPIKIEGNMNLLFKDFLKGHYRIKIKVGKAFFLSSKEIRSREDLNGPTDCIMKEIREL